MSHFGIKTIFGDVGVDRFTPVEENPMNDTIIIEREVYEKGVHGDIIFPGGEIIHSLERPWLDNKPFESCIPCDRYSVIFRQSSLVARLSKGKHTHTYEIVNVPDRTGILFHVGNEVKHSEGCVLTGRKKAFVGDKEPVVWNSGEAFDKFIELMKKYDIKYVEIREKK